MGAPCWIGAAGCTAAAPLPSGTCGCPIVTGVIGPSGLAAFAGFLGAVGVKGVSGFAGLISAGARNCGADTGVPNCSS